MAMMICGQCDEAVHAPGGEVLAAMDVHKAEKHGKTVKVPSVGSHPDEVISGYNAPDPRSQNKKIRRKR